MTYCLTDGVQFNPGLCTGLGMFFYFAINYFRYALPKDFRFLVNPDLLR